MSANITVDRSSQTFTSSEQPEADVCCLHTTEVWGWPAYAGGGQAPHATIKPLPGKGIEVREHIPTTQYAKALMNLPGGVETNRRGVLQYELMGTCDEKRKAELYFWPDADDVVLAALADYLRPILAQYRIPPVSPAFKAYRPDGRSTTGGSYGANGVRFTADQWNAFNGLCGHQHVPENDHGDPGAFPIDRLIAHLANQKDDPLMALTDDQQKQLLDRVTNASVMAQAASVRTQRIEAALRALATSLPAATAAAVTAALNADYDAKVELTPKES